MDLNTPDNKQAVKDAASEVKNETIDTFNQVKDTVKNTDFKEEAKNSKGFILEFLANPVELLSSVANGLRNVLGTAIFLMIVAIVFGLLAGIFRGVTLGNKLMMILRGGLTPIISVLVPAIVVLLINKENKKPMSIIIQVLVLAYIPLVIYGIAEFLRYFVSNSSFSDIVRNLYVVLFTMSIILQYFGMKELFDEEDHSKFIKKYFLIVVLSQVCIYVISLLNLVNVR